MGLENAIAKAAIVARAALSAMTKYIGARGTRRSWLTSEMVDAFSPCLTNSQDINPSTPDTPKPVNNRHHAIQGLLTSLSAKYQVKPAS